MHALLVAESVFRLPLEAHQVLARRGHSVTSTMSLGGALAMQHAAPADIVVIDWDSTKSASDTMLHQLLDGARATESAVLAVVRPETRDLEDALGSGVNDYLSLPLVPRSVEARIAVVERWLEQMRTQHASQPPPALHHSLLDPDFKAILDACPEPICMHRKRRFLYANPALIHSLGLSSPEALLGRTVAEVVHPDDRVAVEQRLEAIERTGRPASLREERFLASDGSLRVGEAHSFLIGLDEGPAIVSLGRDLTERRALEAQFRHSSRLASVGALAASVTHELNNPLTLVLCNLSDLARTLPSLSDHVPEPLVQHLERRVHAIEEAATQMRSLAQDLTDFVRAKETVSERVELQKLLERTIRMVSSYAKNQGEVAVLSELTDAGSVQGSETRLLQVFLNLLLNAVDAVSSCPKGAERRIDVRLRREGAELVTSISDSGPGVPKELRSRIFEPFFSTKASGKGTGLGLAVAQSIVSGMNGSITVLDSANGATFEVRLPSAPPQ